MKVTVCGDNMHLGIRAYIEERNDRSEVLKYLDMNRETPHIYITNRI